MTRLSLVLVIFVFSLICQTPTLEGRNLLNMEKKEVPSFKENFVLSTISKERTWPPSPRNNVYTIADNERIFSVQLAKINGLLEESVPSPGAGH
ncbi:hypothetical protein CRYUN_Cryun39dG0050300 [Craigia yunnanensis]